MMEEEAVEQSAPVVAAGEDGSNRGEGELVVAKEEESKDSSSKMDEEETILDLTSFQLHDLSDVELLPTLTELDLTSNRLTAIDPRIATLSQLQVRSQDISASNSVYNH